MEVIEDRDELRELHAAWRRDGEHVAIVPTMGNLHAGHLSLVELAAENNRVVVGRKEDLFKKQLRVSKVNWLSGSPPEFPVNLNVRIRCRHQESPAVINSDGQTVVVDFAEPQRAITPGQYAVFYKGDELVGGGEIGC